MPYYRIQVGSRESIIENDKTLDEVGQIYKDRLVGECDEYGNLRVPYLTPETKAILDKLAKELWSEWDVTEDGKPIRKETKASIPMTVKPQPQHIKRYKVNYGGHEYYSYAWSMQQVAIMDEIHGEDNGEWLNKPNEGEVMHDPMFESVFGESNLAEIIERETDRLKHTRRYDLKDGGYVEVYNNGKGDYVVNTFPAPVTLYEHWLRKPGNEGRSIDEFFDQFRGQPTIKGIQLRGVNGNVNTLSVDAQRKVTEALKEASAELEKPHSCLYTTLNEVSNHIEEIVRADKKAERWIIIQDNSAEVITRIVKWLQRCYLKGKHDSKSGESVLEQNTRLAILKKRYENAVTEIDMLYDGHFSYQGVRRSFIFDAVEANRLRVTRTSKTEGEVRVVDIKFSNGNFIFN